MPESDIGRAYLEDAILQFRKYKDLGDKAIAQVADADLSRAPGSESNSIAVILKHISGNMRSRWTDFLTTEGEKPSRDRDGEFELDGGDTKTRVIERWEEGWNLLFQTLAALSPADLTRTVSIRGEPHTVLQALDRQLTHYAYHVGQVVYVARHFAGSRWKSLSIPKGKSREFDVARDGKPYVLR